MKYLHFGVRTKSGSLYLLEDKKHILGRNEWVWYFQGDEYHVVMVIDPHFLQEHGLLNPGKIHTIHKNPHLIAIGVSSKHIILKENIHGISDFHNKMIFGIGSKGYGNSSAISESFPFK